MSTPNPLSTSLSSPFISHKQFTIAGIFTTVYGLDELPSPTCDVACLWLLHPRLQTQACMEPVAAASITSYNARRPSSKPSSSGARTGLIAVSFDQRNHGTREINSLANESWRTGNPLHAQDLFSSYHGTALDTSLLITHLPGYVFPTSAHNLTKNLVLGISLGGHAAWTCLLHEPRITAAVVVIGCPDFLRLITDRAAKSKLQTWTSTDPPGSAFVGSEDLPTSLVRAVGEWDPAGLLMSGPNEEIWKEHSDGGARRRKGSLMARRLGGKKILNLVGGDDKLVPYDCSRPFLEFLQEKIRGEEGWEVDGKGKAELVNRIFEGVGHEMSGGMMAVAVGFIGDVVEGKAVVDVVGAGEGGTVGKESKI